MGTSAFRPDTVVELDGKQFKLLRKLTDTQWQLEEVRTKRIREFSVEDLLSFYAQGKLIFVGSKTPFPFKDSSAIGKPYEGISDELFYDAKIRRAYVKAILDVPGTRKTIAPIIQSTWEKLKQPEKAPDVATVLRWRARFVGVAGSIASLVDAHCRKGNKEERYPQEVLDFVDKAIDEKYLTRERKTIQDTLDYAQLLVIRENELLPSTAQLPVPTRRLVKRKIDAISAYDRCAKRYGKDAARRKYRAVLRHFVASRPLERAEMDHTRLDLFVIDDATGMPLGRPWLTVCIDSNSRCVLGIFISFEPPSYLTVARCLKHAFLPKVGLNQEFPRIKNRWNAYGVMRELVVDNGREFHSNSLEKVCYTLGTEIHYAPRKHAWFKGKVERFQGTLNRETAHGVPGTTFSNIFEKDDYDPAKHAVVMYSTLKEIVSLWIVDIYHQRPHRSLDTSPSAQWDMNITPEEIIVPDDPAQLDAILGRRDTRKLTHKGIELDGLLYNSREMVELRYELGEKLDVEISIDDSNLGEIVVFSPDGKRMFKARALAFNYANGLSRWQHGVCKRFAKNQALGDDPRAWLEAKETINELIARDVLKKRRKSNVKAARFKGESKGKPAKPAATSSDAPTAETPQSSTPPSLPTPTPLNAPPSGPRPHFSPLITNRSPEGLQSSE